MAPGFLTVQDRRVVDEHGSPVVLRGVGLGGWLK